ncbi:hypothetical protein F4604DRAFT_1672371 [Suillus subluteus]|nr:hypothetical protein F4604DRAFT_1672371 [Suillus subluteus]
MSSASGVHCFPTERRESDVGGCTGYISEWRGGGVEVMRSDGDECEGCVRRARYLLDRPDDICVLVRLHDAGIPVARLLDMKKMKVMDSMEDLRWVWVWVKSGWEFPIVNHDRCVETDAMSTLLIPAEIISDSLMVAIRLDRVIRGLDGGPGRDEIRYCLVHIVRVDLTVYGVEAGSSSKKAEHGPLPDWGEKAAAATNSPLANIAVGQSLCQEVQQYSNSCHTHVNLHRRSLNFYPTHPKVVMCGKSVRNDIIEIPWVHQNLEL